MMRVSGQRLPEAEIAAYAPPATGTGAHAILTPELIEHCQSGLSVLIGVRGADGRPIPGIALGCRILPDGRVRLLARRKGNERILDSLTHDARIAATFTRPVTHRSLQIKGRDAVIGAPGDEDVRATQRQMRVFCDEIIEVDISPDVAVSYCTFDRSELVAIEFTPEAAFVQTPGPGAGTRLGP